MIGQELDDIARQAAQTHEMDLEIEIALAIKRIEAKPHNTFLQPHRALPRPAFEALLRRALSAIPPGDANALHAAVQPLLRLRQDDYTTDVRFGQWIDVAGDGRVDFGLFADIEGRADLRLSWTGTRWQPFWRREGDEWEMNDGQDEDLAVFLTGCFDWNNFNAYVFDLCGIRRA
jgi:hypothetical protein